MRLVIVLCLLVGMMPACKKEKIISGRVYNLVTGDGIENSEVQIFKKLKEGDFHGEPESIFTDADGRFSLKGEYRGSQAQGIRFENYHDSIRLFVDGPQQRRIINGEGNVEFDLPMARLVPITLFFTDTNGSISFAQQEPVRFRMRSFHTDGYYPDGSISFFNQSFKGTFFDFTNTNASVSFLAIEGWNYVSAYTAEEDISFNTNEVYTRDSIFVDVNGPLTQSFTIQIKD